MKKILSLALVMMMVLSTFTMAFAGTFEDVKSDNDNASAIEALAALNVFNGKPDGTFAPDGIVTRAEMAKLIVVAKNLGNIASGTANYTDVPAEYWASGYIAVASQLGIINGRGNGIFDPTATVTYTEACIMLLRAIGYTDANVNAIGDSYSSVAYLAKANELSLIPSGVNVNAGCTRQAVASMLFDTIKTKTVTTDENGNAVEGTKTLISSLANDTDNLDSKEIYVSPADAAKYPAVADYANQYVKAYYTGSKADAEHVVYVYGPKYDTIAVSEDAGKVDVSVVTEDSVNKVKVVVAEDSKTYTGAPAKAYNNNKKDATVSTYATSGTSDSFTMTVDENGVIKTLTKEARTDVALIASGDVYKANATNFLGKALPLDKDNNFDASQLLVTGDVSSIEEIAANDIVEYYTNSDVGIYKMIVTRKSVEGKVEKVSSKGYYINGVAYSLDGVTLELTDEGTFFLNSTGEIAAWTPVSEATNTVTGLIYGLKNGKKATSDAFGGDSAVMPQIAMKLLDGTSKTYDLAVKSDMSTSITVKGDDITYSAGNFAFGTIANALLAMDGTTEVEMELVASSTTKDKAVFATLTLNPDGKVTAISTFEISAKDADVNLTAASQKALINGGTEFYGYDAKAKKIVSYKEADFGNRKLDIQTTIGSDNFYDYVFAAEVLKVADTSSDYAYVLSTAKTLSGDDEVQEFTSYVNGVKKTYMTTEVLTGIANNNFVNLTINADKKVSAASALTASTATGLTADTYAIAELNAKIKIVNVNTPTSAAIDTATVAADCTFYKVLSNNNVIVISKAEMVAAMDTRVAADKGLVVTVYEDDGLVRAIVMDVDKN